MHLFLSMTCNYQNGPDSVKFCHLPLAPMMLFGLSNKLILLIDHYQTPCSFILFPLCRLCFICAKNATKTNSRLAQPSWSWSFAMIRMVRHEKRPEKYPQTCSQTCIDPELVTFYILVNTILRNRFFQHKITAHQPSHNP